MRIRQKKIYGNIRRAADTVEIRTRNLSYTKKEGQAPNVRVKIFVECKTYEPFTIFWGGV
jgi:hypothetical protein